MTPEGHKDGSEGQGAFDKGLCKQGGPGNPEGLRSLGPLGLTFLI